MNSHKKTRLDIDEVAAAVARCTLREIGHENANWLTANWPFITARVPLAIMIAVAVNAGFEEALAGVAKP